MTYTNRPLVVISLYDFTGEALRPWAERGYTCHAFDIQHPREGTFSDGIHYRHADLHSRETLEDIKNEFKNGVAFAMAFPVCTDLAVSGARHFKRKAEQDQKNLPVEWWRFSYAEEGRGRTCGLRRSISAALQARG